MRHGDGCEGLAAVVRSVEARVEHVNGLGVRRVGVDARVVPGALAQLSFLVDFRPGLARVVRAKDAALFRLDDGPHSIRVGGRDRDADLPDRPFGQAFIARQLRPCVAAVRRFEDAGAGAAALQSPGLTDNLPESGVENIGVCRVEDEIDRARLVVTIENLLPGLAAVFRAEDAALSVRAEGVPERRDVDDIRVARVNAHAPYLPRVFEAHALPGLARVGRFVDAVAVRDIAANRRLAHADIDDVRV